MKVLQTNGLKALMSSILSRFIKKTDTVEVTTLAIDNTPTQNSTNLVTSGGVYAVIGNVASRLDTMNDSLEDLL